MTKEWQQYRQLIKRLYVNEGHSLVHVRRELESHGFQASIRAYRLKLKEWNFKRPAANSRAQLGRQTPQVVIPGNELPSSHPSTPLQLINGRADDSIACNLIISTPAEENLIALAPKNLTNAEQAVSKKFLHAILRADIYTISHMLLDHKTWLLENPYFKHNTVEHNTDCQTYPCVEIGYSGDPWCCIAAALPDGAVLDALLNHGIQLHHVNCDGKTPLHLASSNSRVRNIEILVTAGASVTARDHLGQQPLHDAVLANPPSPDAVRKLLELGADVNGNASPARSNGRPLDIALGEPWGHKISFTIVEMLLEAGASIGPSPIAKSNAFRKLLSPWQSRPFWWKAIGFAAWRCLQIFLEQGADPFIEFISVTCADTSDNGTTTLLHEVYHHTPHRALLNALLSGLSEQIIEGRRNFDISFALRDCPSSHCHDDQMSPAHVLRNVLSNIWLKRDNQFHDPVQLTQIVMNVLKEAEQSSQHQQDVVRGLTALMSRYLSETSSSWPDRVISAIFRSVSDQESRIRFLRITLNFLRDNKDWEKIPISTRAWNFIADRGHFTSDETEETDLLFSVFKRRPHLSQLCKEECVLLQDVSTCLAMEDCLKQEFAKPPEQQSGPRIQGIMEMSRDLLLHRLPGADYLRDVKIVFLTAPVDATKAKIPEPPQAFQMNLSTLSCGSLKFKPWEMGPNPLISPNGCPENLNGKSGSEPRAEMSSNSGGSVSTFASLTSIESLLDWTFMPGISML